MMAAVITITDMRKCHPIKYGRQIANVSKIFKCYIDIQRPGFVYYSIKSAVPYIIDWEAIVS